MLKEKLIDKLIAEPDSLNMYFWKNICGTQRCVAGHILQLSGYDLKNIGYVRTLPDNAPEVDSKWIDYENKEKGVNPIDGVIPALARQLWAAEYGDESAKALPFYEDDWEEFVSDLCVDYYPGPHDEVFSFVTADMVVEWFSQN